MSREKNFDFVSKEDEKDFVIGEDELEDACMDVDLRADDPETTTLTNRKKMKDSNFGAEDSRRTGSDDDGSYNIAIDDDIVENVLGGSQERMREQNSENTKKVCKFSMAFICFCAVIYYVVDVLPGSTVYRDIEDHGSAFHYDDEDSFLEKPQSNLFDAPVKIDENIRIPEVYKHAVDVRGPAFSDSETPFFVQHNDGSGVIEDVLSKCLGLTLAVSTQPIPDALKNSLTTFDLEGDPIQTYVSVDLSRETGIMDAKEKKLISEGPNMGLGAIFTNNFHFAGENLFDRGHQARLFTIIRHPVDRTLSEYHTFIQNSEEGTNISVEEFIQGPDYNANWFTAFVGKSNGSPTNSNLQVAKELLRTKYLIGVYDDIIGSLNLFEDYFFWKHDRFNSFSKKCNKKSFKKEYARNFAVYHSIGHHVRKGSKVYNSIIEMNQFDMELYWFGVELNRCQRAWIPELNDAITP